MLIPMDVTDTPAAAQDLTGWPSSIKTAVVQNQGLVRVFSAPLEDPPSDRPETSIWVLPGDTWELVQDDGAASAKDYFWTDPGQRATVVFTVLEE